MTVNEKGAVYKLGAMPTSQRALTNEYKNFKTEVSIDGRSVQEALQTGPNSLQSYLNTLAIEEGKRRGSDFVPDEYVILFPTDPASASTNSTPTDAGATADTLSPTGLNSILGVSRALPLTPGSKGNLVQDGAKCNMLGSAIFDFDANRSGTPPTQKNDVVYQDGSPIKGKVSTIKEATTSNFKFPILNS